MRERHIKKQETITSVVWDDGKKSFGAWAAEKMLLAHGNPPVLIGGLSLVEARALMEGIYGRVDLCE